MGYRIDTCNKCGCDKSVIASPFIFNPRKWTIHRGSGMEVTFEVSDGLTLFRISHQLTEIERDYIFKHIIPNFKQ